MLRQRAMWWADGAAGGGAGGAGGGAAGGAGTAQGGGASSQGGAGAGGASGGAASGGQGGGTADVAALQRELADARKALAGAQATLEEVKGKAAEEQAKLLGGLQAKLAAYELAEKRGAALKAAIRGAAELAVDEERAALYVGRVATSVDQIEGAVKEALALFGTKKAAGGGGGQQGGGGQAGTERVMQGTPAKPEGNGAAGARPMPLGQLFRENPEQYKALIAEQRAKIPFFGG